MLFLGGYFFFDKDGVTYSVSFNCSQENEPSTGISLAVIDEIWVENKNKEVVNHLVDMQEVEKMCIDIAIQEIHDLSNLDLDKFHEDPESD